MKTFIYSVTYNKSRFGQKVTTLIYRVKNNKPELLGENVFNTGSMMGVNHEVLNWLVNNKYLPKKCTVRGGYINYDEMGKTFSLWLV